MADHAGSPTDSRPSTQLEEFQLQTSVEVPTKDSQFTQITTLTQTLSALLFLYGLYTAITSISICLVALVSVEATPEKFRLVRFLQFVLGVVFAGVSVFGYKSTDVSVPASRQVRLGNIFSIGGIVLITLQVVLSALAFYIGKCDNTEGFSNPAASAVFHTTIWTVFHAGALLATVNMRKRAINSNTLPH
jgi:hypothetical protein